MKAQGIDVINLGAGEPDFNVDPHICHAVIEAIGKGQTKYTSVDGISELKQAICEKFKRDNGLIYSPSQINVSPGGKAVIYNALAVSLNPGDQVIIPTPCWVSYPDMVKFFGGAPVIIKGDQSRGFKISPKQLDAAITDKTKWFILNSPSNPTGLVYTQTELRALGEVLQAYPHIMILADDIYEHIIYDGQEFATIAQACPTLYSRVLTMNGVSKAYAMTGLRIGFAAGPEEVIKAMAKIMGQSSSNPASISQWAALAALCGSQSELKSRLKIYQKRRDFVCQSLAALPLISCAVPQGAFYVFADISKLIGRHTKAGTLIADDKLLAQALLEEAHLATIPGTAFYCSGFLRLSFAADMDRLSDAMKRLGDFLKDVH